MKRVYKALTIRQPYAWFVMHGFKDVENRSWPTSYRGQLLIHAAASYDGPKSQQAEDRLNWNESNPDAPMPEVLDLGGIVGLVNLVDVVDSSPSPWFVDGSFGFVLDSAQPLKFIAMRGQLGLWSVTLDENQLEPADPPPGWWDEDDPRYTDAELWAGVPGAVSSKPTASGR